MTELARLLQQLRRREARRRNGAELTYRELSAKTGWSLGIIAQYFSGKSLPPVDRFDVLIRLLGATPAEQGTLATARDRADEQRRGHTAMPHRADVRLLGPVEVVGPRGRAGLHGTRQRALIGLLALDAGRLVTQDRLVDALWDGAPPRTAVNTLYSHIARVRQSLDACGLPGLLVTRGPGYALTVRPDEVDVNRFAELVAKGRRALADSKPADAATALRHALSLWHGEALVDVSRADWAAAEAQRLHEMRLGAQEELLDARLRLGEHRAAVDELERLARTHPLRERLIELLMLALYRCDRQAEALEAYQRLRAYLSEQLGVEPGPAAARMHTAVLHTDPGLDLAGAERRDTNIVRPAQLPCRVGHFVGRAAALSFLDGLLQQTEGVGVVCGPGGMGKTALAVQWGHRTVDQFPDGQLFLDVRGHDPATATPVAEILNHLLRGLGVPPAELPSGLNEMFGLYRSLLHGRRVLIVLDNAASAEQVLQFVPPTSGSRMLVTSRNQLAALAMECAITRIDLDLLTPDEAITLLREVLGAQRLSAEPAHAVRLLELCERMPLALRIAMAKLAASPLRTIAELVSDLDGADRLTILAVPGESRSIRTVFASAYNALSKPTARLFRRLGLHPGASFTPAMAATITTDSTVDTRRALDELAAAHLISEAGGGHYRFHDLIRLYAAELAEPGERGETSRQIIDWYLVVADAANRVFDPARDRAGPVCGHLAIEVPFPAAREDALRFLDGERANLLPVVRFAMSYGDDQASWRLAYLLTSFHILSGYRAEHAELCRLGLASALRLGDPAAESLMRSLVGMACNFAELHEEALEHLHRALELMRAVGDRRGQGLTLNNIALAHGRLGRLDAAVGAFGQALEVHTADGNEPGIALALNNLGHMHTLLGNPDLAFDHLNRALVMARHIGSGQLEACSLQNLGEACLAQTDMVNALTHFATALVIRRQLGERRGAVETLHHIGGIHRSHGDETAASAHFEQALVLSRELGDGRLEEATLALLRAGG